MFEELSALLEEAKTVEIAGDGEYTELPEGEYQAIVDGAQFKESKAGNLMFEWEFIINDGSYKNRHHWKYNVLNSPENMKRLITELTKFGINTTTMDTINGDLDNLVNVPVTLTIKHTVSKKTGQNFVNTSVNPCNS